MVLRILPFVALTFFTVPVWGQASPALHSAEEQMFAAQDEPPVYLSPACSPDSLTKAQLKECSQQALLDDVYGTLAYPAEVLRDSLEGMAVIGFVVKTDGSVGEPTILRDPGHGMGAAALEVVKTLGPWEPGRQNGKPVQVRYTLPVKFEF